VDPVRDHLPIIGTGRSNRFTTSVTLENGKKIVTPNPGGSRSARTAVHANRYATCKKAGLRYLTDSLTDIFNNNVNNSYNGMKFEKIKYLKQAKTYLYAISDLAESDSKLASKTIPICNGVLNRNYVARLRNVFHKHARPEKGLTPRVGGELPMARKHWLSDELSYYE
jgi:hypothetical protein